MLSVTLGIPGFAPVNRSLMDRRHRNNAIFRYLFVFDVREGLL